MELRYASLIKEQQKVLAEAERAIDKREIIDMRSQAIKEPAKQIKKPENQQQFKHAIRNSKENQNKIMRTVQETEKQLSRKEGELDAIAQNIEDSTNDLKRLEN